ncbi:unnamed protein product, partial [Prorocentrum cordatum]
HESGSVRARLPQPPQALRRPRRASEGNSARARVRARPSCGVVGGAARGTLGGAPARGAVRRRAAQSMAIAHCTPHRSDRRPPVLGRAETPKVDVDGSSVRLRLQPHPSFGCASHLQGTRESRNRWARPPSAGRRAASRRVEKAITKNPAPSAATTKSARAAAPRRGWAAKTGSHRGRGLRGCAEGPRAPQRSGQLSRAAPTHRCRQAGKSTCLCTVGNSQLQHTCAPQGAGIVSNPTAPGAMLPQRRAQRC